MLLPTPEQLSDRDVNLAVSQLLQKYPGAFVIVGDSGLGLMPHSAQRGDEVWLLRGAVVPFVLRPAEGGKYRLVGESYIHGAMFGEMMTEEVKASFRKIEIV